MPTAFACFVFLQIADLATTVAVLNLGGHEQNPLILALMSFGPLAGLVVAKCAALAIGVVCLVASRHRALRVANFVFVAIVAWNLSIAVRLLL